MATKKKQNEMDSLLIDLIEQSESSKDIKHLSEMRSRKLQSIIEDNETEIHEDDLQVESLDMDEIDDENAPEFDPNQIQAPAESQETWEKPADPVAVATPAVVVDGGGAAVAVDAAVVADAVAVAVVVEVDFDTRAVHIIYRHVIDGGIV